MVVLTLEEMVKPLRSKTRKTFKSLFYLLSVLIILLSTGCKKKNPVEEDNPQIDFTDLSVRDVVCENGCVAAANPYAAKVGIDILKNGGNAFDAAVAVSLALGVVEMDASGIGGGGLMIAYNVNSKQSLFYNFREFASSMAQTDLSHYAEMGDRYNLYTGVPTLLAGLSQILKEQGTKTLKEVFAPAIDLAENGCVATPELINNINDNSTKINRNDYLKQTFKRENGSRLREGDIIKQTALANTFKLIAEKGIEEFYQGTMADKIVETVTKNGGIITKEDLKLALNKNYFMEDSIIKGTYKDYDVLTVGSPSSGGAMLIEMLNMIEAYKDVTKLKHNSAEYVNLLATVMQLAYGDKEKYLADELFVDIPLDGLLSKEYAASRIEKYQVGKAYLGTALSSEEQPYGDAYAYSSSTKTDYELGMQESHYSTTSFSIVDKEGNMVTITQTINNFFGSGISPEGTGFFLNDQLKDFSYIEGSINVIEPLKQPASYMLPTVVLKNGKPFATLGTPGGSRIPAAGLQVFLNMTDFNMNMQEAINAPRIYCFTTNESNRLDKTKQIYIENALNNIKEELSSFGYEVISYADSQIHSYFGGVQGVKVEGANYHGGADPRRDGKALGY